MAMINAGIIDINEEEFKKIAKLVYTQFGINLTDKKRALVRGRLNKVIREKGFHSFQQYYDSIMEDKTGVELIQLVDKISTNHTYFFRENDHFEFLVKEELPAVSQFMENNREQEYRIWCAGCATGEEAYTLAMLINEYRKTHSVPWKARILATDISISALEKAQAGVYPRERMEGVPKDLLNKYFTRNPQGDYQVSKELKKLILFKKLNFMRPDFPFKNKFHTIFCRNVMIYFDKQTKDELVNKFARFLRKEGRLFIGHSETLGRENENFVYIKPALYQRTN